MEIKLGKIYADDKGYFTSLHDNLTKDQHEKLLTAIYEILDFENDKKLLHIVILNSNDFIKITKSSFKEMIDKSLSVTGDKETYYFNHLNFNRLFLNYLSSIRTFIDHSETTIKRRYSENSKEYSEFKKTTKYYFDNYFSYRFLYKLRNYAQHIGLPIEEIEISATMIAENTFKTKSLMEFNAQELLNKKFDWGKDVKMDLESKTIFDLYPIIDEMSEIIVDFWHCINFINSNRVLTAAEFINQTAGHLKEEKCKVCVFKNITYDEFGNPRYFETLQIPFDIIDNIKIEQKKQ